MTARRRAAVLSFHTDPLGDLGGDVTGGMNVFVREMARTLPRLGWEADVFTRACNTASPRIETLAPGVRLVRVQAGPRRNLTKQRLVPSTGSFAEAILSMAGHEGRAYNLIAAHYWLSGLSGEKLARAWDAPMVVRFHTLAAQKNRSLPAGGARESPERIRGERALARRADALLASSPGEAEMIESNLGAPPGQTYVVPCGVDTRLFRPIPQARERLGLKQGEFLILSIGRIEPVKGLDLLVTSLARLKERNPSLAFRTVHIGGALRTRTGKQRGRVKPEMFASPRQRTEVKRVLRLAERAGVVKRFAFFGARPQEELPLWYSAADVMAIPSRYETFSLVALEAAACGLPAVAYHVGGIEQAIEDGRSGLLVPGNDPAAFAEALERLARTPRERAMLGRAARKRSQGFSWHSVATQEVAIWNHLLDAKGSVNDNNSKSSAPVRATA